MIRNAADLEELIQNSLDNIDSASDETILSQVQGYFEQNGAASDLVAVLKITMNCAVCLEIPVKGCQLTECKHVFCISCLSLWFFNNTTCPLCRREAICRPRDLTAIDPVVKKILRTHDANYWKERLEEDNLKIHSFVIKYRAEGIPRQIEQLMEWEQTIYSDDMGLNEEGIYYILKQTLALVKEYAKYLEMPPMNDGNKRELVFFAIDLNCHFRDYFRLMRTLIPFDDV